MSASGAEESESPSETAAASKPPPASAEAAGRDDEADSCPAPSPGAVGGGRLRRWYRRRPRWFRRVLISLLVLFLAVAAGIGTLGAALFAEGSGTPAAAARSTGHDALWLGHAWVGWPPGAGKDAKTDADFADLVALVRDSGVKDLFVHDGPFGMDGTLDPAKSPRAEWFVTAVHRDLPGVRVQAWLGQETGGSRLRLDAAPTRDAVVAGVGAALASGFDGVHFDFEPVEDGDSDFLAVLAASRRVTSSRGAVLSVSAPQVELTPGWQAPGDAVAGHAKWWSTGYLREVAHRTDQVALMAYDTALPTAWAYRGYVARQTEVARSAVPADVALFIGVPAYHTDNSGHWSSAETMPAALRGVRLGMGARPGDRSFGVALYVDFAATPADWAAYRSDWLSPR